jgi:hypothetical protein
VTVTDSNVWAAAASAAEEESKAEAEARALSMTGVALILKVTFEVPGGKMAGDCP